MIQTLIQYHIATTRRVWESIEHITEEQFLLDDVYSRGSIRNLMVHLASTDRRWLAGLKSDPDVGHLNPADYPARQSARAIYERIAQELMDYTASLSAAELDGTFSDIPAKRWQVLMQLVNHGTDHRSTVLQKLHEFGVPTFDQDFIIWLWNQKG